MPYATSKGIADYIAIDSPAYASAVVRKIVSQVRLLLTRFPHSGRIVPEFDDERIREVFAYSYRVIYRASENEVTVSAVVHGRRVLE